MMRPLSPPPAAIVDPATLRPVAGAFRGSLPRVDLGALSAGRVFSLLHRKRWVYLTIVRDDLCLALAVVHVGYAVSCFFFAFDRREGRMLVDRSHLLPPLGADVGEDEGGGLCAIFRQPLQRTTVDLRRGKAAAAYTLSLRAPDLEVDAQLEASGAPPPISVIAPLAGPPAGLLQTTQKMVLLPVIGEARIRGRRHGLDGGLAGIDYSHGYLAHRTAWQWAFLLGRARSGERVALNLVEGFVGEPECAAWIEGDLYPLAEGRFAFDKKAPERPWQVRTADDAVNLRFEPGAVHAEIRSYGIVTSRFVQPVGSFTGSLRIEGRTPIDLDRVLGVVEDQDVVW